MTIKHLSIMLKNRARWIKRSCSSIKRPILLWNACSFPIWRWLAQKNLPSQDKDVLVLLTDMTAFADSIKEIMITMDQVPSNRGYPGSLYSDLASRYEKAVDIDGSGSITIISVTTMPGGDVTHPIPDNTGYITEGQFYLHGGRIDPFGSLSRLKQQVIGKVTREDHGDIANAQIRLYADSKKARERQSMGFKLSRWDEKLLTLFSVSLKIG